MYEDMKWQHLDPIIRLVLAFIYACINHMPMDFELNNFYLRIVN